MNKIGIYQISNTKNDLVYIGRSEDIQSRWKRHKVELRKGTHKNKNLQALHDEHGEDSLIFEVLEECSLSELAFKELDYIYWFYPDVLNVVTWKDYIRYQLAINLLKFGFEIEIDYKDERCKGASGRVLTWAIHMEKDNQHYFVHISNVDYEGNDKYDDVRYRFIDKYGYNISYIEISKNNQEDDIIQLVKTTEKEIIRRAEQLTRLFSIA